MSYQKQNFRDGEVLSAEQLNRMEEGIAKLETNMITAEEPTASEDVQSAVESILKSIEDKGNNILSQIQQTGSKKGLTVYCWGDSLTQGIGGNVNGWHLISYPQVLNDATPSTSASCLTTCRQSWRGWVRTQSSFQRVQFRAVQVKASLLGTQQTG